jgi:acyl transferase domain-containing protein/acyl carrier protein/2-polyprenyl-3-methyl-5-hydroxy-6-metoxy-1,4-benzoquinol methylase
LRFKADRFAITLGLFAMTSQPATQPRRKERDGIAIIGMGCRFPGGVHDAGAFWKLLVERKEAVCEVPADRWNTTRFYDPEPGIVAKSLAKRGGFLTGIDLFDPQFFGISPREAPYIDPQQRLLLETAWEAIEDAGMVLNFEGGTDMGVFVGISHNDYQGLQHTPTDRSGISAHTPIGSAHSIAANRISYCLNLSGPSIAMDTACSSALTAVHVACDNLRAGRCRAALAGGVTVMIAPDGFIGFSQAGMLSPEGRCKAFDASADGFVRGEGAGMILLKRLSDALEDGDPIHAVILGSSLNQDGHTNGISLPSPAAQARLVADACVDAGVQPSQIAFVEAHGTGTAVGDPIEATALGEALCAGRPADDPLLIGSVKTNLGHLETASGIAGLMKAVLVLKHRQIPASLHFQNPNPHIDFEALKLRIPVTLEPFPSKPGNPRLAGVNSFGFGGANSHVILAEAPEQPPPRHDKPGSLGRAWPLVLSARSERALKSVAARLADWLGRHSQNNGDSPLLEDLAHTLGARRNHHSHRLTLTATSMNEAADELAGFANGEPPTKARRSFTPRPERPLRVAFVLSGQGTQSPGMGLELMKHEPVFRDALEQCAAAMQPHAEFRLLEELARPDATSRMSRTGISQPAIFAIQMALAALWKSWGVEPVAIVGHSVGEVAAACVSGILTLEEAAKTIVLRGRCMDEHMPEGGGMLAVGLAPAEASALIARHDRTVAIAAFNGPQSLTLAGRKASLEAISAELEAREIFSRFLKVDYPFHHPLMQPAAQALLDGLSGLSPAGERIPFFSTVVGARLAGTACDAAHWARGVEAPVQFEPAIRALCEEDIDVWLEVGAHPALVRSVQECLGAGRTTPRVFASMRRERELESALESALDLHMAGVALHFHALTPPGKLLTLPAYPWDRERWWNECPETREGRLAPGGRGLLDVRLSCATPTWITRLDARHMSYLSDHRVENLTIFPAAGFVGMVLEAGVQLFEGAPFVIEDFEIRKPLILPDPVSGLLLELAMDPLSQTFSIQSRFENSASWSVHVVGALRHERTDSAFAQEKWEHQPGLEDRDVASFYAHMAGMGLRYGEEFRPIRQLSACEGRSVGTVALSAAVSQRANDHPLHPVLLDGALQVFSAGAATIEGRNAGLRLPVRFARILFLRPPGSSIHAISQVAIANEELVEGGIRIFNGTGQPCVCVQGFRAISVEGARRSARTGKGRDVTYHVAWEKQDRLPRVTSAAPPSLPELKAQAEAAWEDVVGMRGRAHLEAAGSSGDVLALAQVARGFVNLIRGTSAPFTAESVGVATGMRPAFARLAAELVRSNLLTTEDHIHFLATPALNATAAAREEVLRSHVAQYPGHLPEAMLCEATTSELDGILRAEKDAIQILFSGSTMDALDQFYGDAPAVSPWLAAIGRMVESLAAGLPEGRGLRILEVGAGTGGLASMVLPRLERDLHSYVFSDVSASFFPAARQKLASFPEVEFQICDLDQPGAAGGIEPGSFDLILGTNVLHAASDVMLALAGIENLLAPGGNLLFMDVASPHLWLDAVFGLTSGWWRFTDRNLRTAHPLLTRTQWESALEKAGFAEVCSMPGLLRPNGDESLICLLARKAPAPAPPPALPEASFAPGQSWVIFADEQGHGHHLACLARAAGVRCRVVAHGPAFAETEPDSFALCMEHPEDCRSLLDAFGEDIPTRFVVMWTLDRTPSRSPWATTHFLLYLAQALEEAARGKPLAMDLVTRGAQSVGRSHPVSVWQAPCLGFLRVLANEYPNIACRSVDLSPSPTEAEGALLLRELACGNIEREVALRGEARYVRRIARGLQREDTILDPSIPLRLESRDRGLLDSLRLVPFASRRCAPGEVEIEVRAAGMNFRDVLKALALYPAETADARIFGDEVAGVVTSVGDGVTHVFPGQKVFGLAVFGLATHSLARAGDVLPIPEGVGFEEAATLPVVFMTAWHALTTVAHLAPGETILVHAGAGGVGMAAIQIAHHLGAQVIATAGSPAKRSLLKALGVRHVLDSRRGDFTESVLELTAGRGVDVVLNSLASEAIPMGLSCLAEFGRFIEIGKRDIYQNTRIPLWPLRRNASFHVVAMDAIFGGSEERTRQLLKEVADKVSAGTFRPLPFRSFPACRVDAAFRHMAQGKHIGKILVSFPEPFLSRRGEPPASAFTVDPDATYLITGGFGGFGRVLASWLAECGARHIALASRNGPTTPEAHAFLDGLRERGVTPQVVLGDVGSPGGVSAILDTIVRSGHPLRGVFHLAMIIDDAPIVSLNEERMNAVLNPKAMGAWLLHEQTLGCKLDHFILFSSVSSTFGNPAQANYAAANAFLDALAHHRHAIGLPALTINWGALGGEGYVARNERVAEYLARQGTIALQPTEVTSLMESFLTSGTSQAIALRADWAKWRATVRGSQENPLMERLFADSVETSNSASSRGDWRLKIESAAPEQRGDVILLAVLDIVGAVLRVKPENLRPDQPLTDLGLDSLMAVEIETSLDGALGIALPPASLMRARTIAQIAALIAEHLAGAKAASVPAAPSTIPVAEESLDVDVFSDEEIGRLFAGEADALNPPPTEVRS